MTTSLSKLHFRFWRFIVSTNKTKDFYELWQLHKQLKAMEMSEPSLDILKMRNIYINSKLKTTHKIHWQKQKRRVEKYHSIEYLSNDDEDHPNHHGNSQ